MRRRDFITLVGGAAVAWPLAALGQEAGRTYRIGALSSGPRSSPLMDAMFDEVRRFGFIEGQNLTVYWHQYLKRIDLIPEFAEELVKAHVDVIFCRRRYRNSRRTAGNANDSNPRHYRKYGRVGVGELATPTRRQYNRHELPRGRS